MKVRTAARGTALALLVTGCSASPAQNILGSFFPAWMLCAVLGIGCAIVVRQVLCALGINQHLLAPPLTYACVAVAATLAIWLQWFGH